MQIRVYYEDIDVGGIVYHANYLKFCERARSELFFQNNLSPHNNKSFFVVTTINANFIGSAKLGDTIYIKTKLLKEKKVSVVLMQEIYKDDKIIYTQEVKLAYLINDKISVIPKEQLDILKGKI